MEPIQAVVIGASAGAIQALSLLLPALPASFPVPVLVAVHIPADRSDLLPSLFKAKCRLCVKEIEDKEAIKGGVIYFAAPDYHFLIERDQTVSLSSDDLVNYSRPSIDVLFESAADAYGAGLVGIVLTGANDDGAQGLAAIAAAGGTALVETPSEAFAATMPGAALARCPLARSMSLGAMTDYLVALTDRRAA